MDKKEFEKTWRDRIAGMSSDAAIRELEQTIFFIQMDDNWDADDYWAVSFLRKLEQELQ